MKPHSRILLLGAIGAMALLDASRFARAGDWPQWRGANRDGKSTDTGLLKSWPENGPTLAWKMTGLGRGFAGVSVAGDRIYTMGDKEVTSDRGAFSVEPVYANKTMANHHGGVVKVGDHLYGHSDGKSLTCQDFKTGAAAWAEKEKVKKGCLSYADGRLYYREEDSGALILVEASPSGFSEKGRFQQPNRANDKAWPHQTIANGKLYLRDQDVLLCYDVTAK